MEIIFWISYLWNAVRIRLWLKCIPKTSLSVIAPLSLSLSENDILPGLVHGEFSRTLNIWSTFIFLCPSLTSFFLFLSFLQTVYGRKFAKGFKTSREWRSDNWLGCSSQECATGHLENNVIDSRIKNVDDDDLGRQTSPHSLLHRRFVYISFPWTFFFRLPGIIIIDWFRDSYVSRLFQGQVLLIGRVFHCSMFFPPTLIFMFNICDNEHLQQFSDILGTLIFIENELSYLRPVCLNQVTLYRCPSWIIIIIIIMQFRHREQLCFWSVP